MLLRRLPVFAAVVILTVFLMHGRSDPRSPWRRARVAVSAQGPFEDVEPITYSISCMHQGLNPYAIACDPQHRPLNYPPVWLQLRWLGVDASRTGSVGWTFALLLGLAYLAIFSTRSVVTGACAVGAVLMSRPLLLAMERSNTDEVVFFLLVTSCALASQGTSRFRRWFFAVCVVVLTCLKIYPFVASVALIRTRKGVLIVAGTVLASAIALILTAGRELKPIFRATPTLVDSSFGIIPLAATVAKLTHRTLKLSDHRGFYATAALLIFIGAAVLGTRARHALAPWLPPLEAESFHGILAVACASIYCFAFVGGASFNYRLIYLAGVLAFLLVSYDSGASKGLPLILLLLAFMAIPGRFVGAHEMCDLLTFLTMAAWLGVFISHRPVHLAATGAMPVQPAYA